ncbi:MFS transporter [Sphingomonas sp. T1]|jgi:MFS family permease|uniref:MFS transporter n=1 Tax=unclassified Sphingomonas TaxID=196159 RepID=UPI000538FE58|nr:MULTISPECIES: MFS transporter [unclassified Sphingomonas]KHA64054.1 MFS transporter [Sphingomonas sp. Ant20]MBD8469766.1 MFS transporter [Sphingomonas sp. CFBP 8765]VXC73022.1 MFS transporter [Sphingomonas sp. T1]
MTGTGREDARIDRRFALMFLVMLTIAAGNTALQSVLPALGRSLGVADSAVAGAFSVSALLWVIAAPFWANRSDRHGRRAMILLGIGGFSVSLTLCGLFLMAGINHWIGGTAAFGCFIAGRLIYGAFGAAAPPAVQALVAGETTRAERTRALTLLASAFGLGTILGPAIAPYLILGSVGGLEVGLAGPAFLFALFGVAVWITVRRMLPDDRIVAPHDDMHGASSAYPSIGGAPSGASVTAATQSHVEQVGYTDPRIRAWMIAGLVMGHAQAMTGQAIGFLVIDRLNLAPALALEPTGIVLMMGAGAALLAQWGIIPRLNLTPRQLVLTGLVLAAAGTALTGIATSLYTIATAYALASLGFGFTRPGFTAGASLAVGANAQGSVAGKVTSINGASFVLGPSIGVGLYEAQHSLPYLVAGAACVVLIGYAWVTLNEAKDASGG